MYALIHVDSFLYLVVGIFFLAHVLGGRLQGSPNLNSRI